MKSFKKVLFGFLILFLTLLFLMFVPRIWSALNPEDAPLGYYFYVPTVAAVYTGLDPLIVKTPPVPENVEAIKNIEYKKINERSLQLDLYKPRTMTAPAPLLVFIHGGGWRGGDRADYLVYLTHFANLGYVTATASYRLLKVAPYPACAEDIMDAVQFLYQNGDKYNYDPDRICLIGGSAGAHLAMLAGYGWKKPGAEADSAAPVLNRHKIKAVVEIYGPTDFTTEYARNHPTITGFMAHSYEEAPQLYVEASPITYVNKDTPPTLILQGTRDMLVPLSQAELLKHKLDSMGVTNVYRPVPGWPHTMDMVQRV
ncbi:MAG TPA: alpha/beta hydrolase, partial [Prolixibacteraceae bacterium]|nr:alpha/beta hydrolase [Prolixibacteraceae bacterium]